MVGGDVLGLGLCLLFGWLAHVPITTGETTPPPQTSGNVDSSAIAYQVVTALMILIVLFLGFVVFFLMKYDLDICTWLGLMKTNFVDMMTCKFKKDELHEYLKNRNGGSPIRRRREGDTDYNDTDTLGELPPPRVLQDAPPNDDGGGILPTESMQDLRNISTSSSEADIESEEDECISQDINPPQPTPVIKVDDYIKNYGSKNVDQAKLKTEYEVIAMWSKLINKNKSHAKLEKNRTKNRYFDIVPYNYNRVPLYDVQGIRGIQEYTSLNTKDKAKIGYINASYIHEYGTDRLKYIAAQGPLGKTMRDFWKMVWQEGSDVVVMLTSLREQGKVKCEQYWPKEKGEELDFGDIKAKLEVSQCYAYYDYRIVVLQYGDLRRSVHHYLYHHWPDKEAPEMVVPVLDLYHKIFKSNHSVTYPIVIHCSAGVGRTGTFISLDYLLDQAKQTGEVDVARCVYELRRQRVSMVQKVSQYMFVYEALHEALEAKQTMVTAANFQDWYKDAENDEAFVILKHFQMVRSKCPAEPLEAEGLAPENINKNRDQSIIPYDPKRPFLITYTKGRTNYINAVFVDTFLETDCIITTQVPLEGTIDDFWRLIYDRNCAAVLLLEPNDGSFAQFWPADRAETVYGGAISVCGGENKKLSTSKVSVRNYTVVLMEQPNYVVDVKFLQLKTWPRGHSIPPNKLDLVDLMTMWRKYKRQSSIVQCMDGAEKSGLFCGCTYVVDQIQTDHEVDIYHAARMMTASRPQFLKTKDQYKFLHEFALEFIHTFDDYSNFTEAGAAVAMRSSTKSKNRASLPSKPSKAHRKPPSIRRHSSNTSDTSRESIDNDLRMRINQKRKESGVNPFTDDAQPSADQFSIISEEPVHKPEHSAAAETQDIVVLPTSSGKKSRFSMPLLNLRASAGNATARSSLAAPPRHFVSDNNEGENEDVYIDMSKATVRTGK